MSEHTGTLWIVLMTPQKNLLAKISSLKTFGKIKIEELKVSYRKKNAGGWFFQILNQPKGRTFSFHDGEAILKTKNGYVPLRSFSFLHFFRIAILVCLGLSVWVILTFSQSKSPVPVTAAQVVVPAVTAVVEEAKTPQVKIDPKMHDVFLEAKREFQYGQMASSFAKLKKNMDAMNEADQKESAGMLSEMFFLQCENFQRQHEERKAVMSCEKAVKISQHAKAEIFLTQQDEKSRKLYLEGYTIQKFDPKGARKKYALVLQSSQTKSPWRGKAQYQLRKLK